MGIKSWLTVEKAKTDSPIELEANLALIPPLLGLYKKEISSFVNRYFYLFGQSVHAPLIGQ